MKNIKVGDDVWAFGLTAPGLYDLLARFTVCDVGTNPIGSYDRHEYGEYYFRSTSGLSNYFEAVSHDLESVIRSLSVQCNGAVLGQCFQGRAGVRQLTPDDRRKLIAYLAR